MDRIERVLLELKVDGEKRSVLGSYALYKFLGEHANFTPNDIDVFCFETDHSKFRDIVDSLDKTRYKIINDKHYVVDIRVRGWRKRDPVLSLVWTKVPLALTMTRFDLSCCKFSYFYTERYNQFTVIPLDYSFALMAKSRFAAAYLYTTDRENTERRIEKYTQRGFDIATVNLPMEKPKFEY